MSPLGRVPANQSIFKRLLPLARAAGYAGSILADRAYPTFVAECGEWRRRRPDAGMTAVGDEVRVMVPAQAPTRDVAEAGVRGDLVSVFPPSRYRFVNRG